MYPADRTPTASVNYVTCHDGFTLRDVVSYCHKRNDANQERNRDGADDNHSWNCGAEGSTEDPVVLTRRYRSRRNLITTLMLSQGVPMICGGDELGRTQLGNNNAYCQDSAVSWFDWRLSAEDARFLRFVRELVGFRAQHPVLKRRRFLGGRLADGSEDTDLSWLDPGGQEMTERVWSTDDRRAVGMLLSVPLTMVVKIVLTASDDTRWLGLLLSDEVAESV